MHGSNHPAFLAPRRPARAARAALASLVAVASLTFAARAQPDSTAASKNAVRPAPLPELPAAVAPGAQVTFTSASGATDTRRERLIALAVPASTPVSALLPPGPFSARWETTLTVPLRTDVTFSFTGRGRVELTLNGKAVLTDGGTTGEAAAFGRSPGATVRLNKGANALVVAYQSPAEGEAVLRLLWAGRGFGREPVPPTLLSHDPAAPALRAGDRIRRGRELVAELHCLRCHDAGSFAPEAGQGLPELAHAPPYLDAGARLREAWVAAWIADPKAMRPDASMPKLAFGSPRDAADIAAFLATTGKPAPAPAATPAHIAEGAHLFTALQCVSCHALPGAPLQVGDASRVSLAQVPAKWQPAGLVEFLKKPEALHPASRMPNFGLSQAEAEALAAFLLSREGGVAPPAVAGGDVERGQTLFASTGCLNCHAPGAPPRATPIATTLAHDWTAGCLGTTPAERGTAPDFGLTAEDREALRAFAATDWSSLKHDPAAEFAERQMVNLNCTACHARDNRASTLSAVKDEIAALETEFPRSGPPAGEGEESLDTEAPLLTWAGEKLKTDFLHRQIAGTVGFRSRPWLEARMPAFAAQAEPLARGLALAHGLVPGAAETAAPAAGDAARLDLARHLSGPEAFNCVQCHAVGAQPASAPFGAPGIDFAHVHERLRSDYFVRWMDNPSRLVPGTKMPKFTDAQGRSLQPDALDGDAHSQWAALYDYLATLRSTEPRP